MAFWWLRGGGEGVLRVVWKCAVSGEDGSLWRRWGLALFFLSLSSLPPLSLLASVGCGCVLGMHKESGVLSVGLCVLFLLPPSGLLVEFSVGLCVLCRGQGQWSWAWQEHGGDGGGVVVGARW